MMYSLLLPERRVGRSINNYENFICIDHKEQKTVFQR